MKSQVSFTFDGEHNKSGIVLILKQNLKDVKYKFETLSKFVHRIYVGANEDANKTLEVCRGIQCYALMDNTKEL